MLKIGRQELQTIWEKTPVDYYEKGIKNNFGQKYWHHKKYQIIEQVVKESKPTIILDIGCHSGDLTARIANLFPNAQTYGVDVYEKAIKGARKKFPKIIFLVADAQKLPFPKNTFDLILCSETLEHVVFPQKVLKEIKRCLKDGEIAIISMDSGSFMFNLIWFLWTHFGKGKVWAGSHLSKFNRHKLKKMITQSGFLIKEEIISHFGMSVTFKLMKK